MALQNILDAIVQEADDHIAALQTNHRQTMRELREASERALAKKKRLIADDKEQRMRRIRERAVAQAQILKSRLMLARKQECMDKLYERVLQDLTHLPHDRTETFLKHCMKHLRGTGVIRPAKAHEEILRKLLSDGMEMGKPIDSIGGFRCSSAKEEHDCTYEFLVHGLLRPLTDIDASHRLFPHL